MQFCSEASGVIARNYCEGIEDTAHWGVAWRGQDGLLRCLSSLLFSFEIVEDDRTSSEPCGKH